MTDQTPLPPAADKRPVELTQLGRTRVDPYAWLKDENWRAVLRDPAALRPDIRAHLERENAYTQAVLAPTEALQAQLFAEMRGRIKEDDSSVPSPDGPYDYFVRYEAGAEHPQHLRRPRGGGAEELLLDVDALSKGHGYYAVGAAEHSDDHRLYAYAEDAQGSEVYTVRIKDLASGELLPHAVESTTGDFALSPDGRWLFWTFRDEEGRPSKIYRRPVAGGEDVLVYDEPDEGFFIGVGVTQSRAWIVISAGNQETSEAWVIPAAEPEAAPRCIRPREAGVRYELEHWPAGAPQGEEARDRFVLRTNIGGAVDFKLVETPTDATDAESWRDLVPHRPGRLIAGVQALKGWLVRLERADALPAIVARDQAGAEHSISFDEAAYALSFSGGYEWDTDAIRFVYESPTTPRQTFDYDLRTRERTLRKTQEVPSGHDPARYVAERLHARAADGAEVPITLLRLRETPADGSAPLMVYGYGSYGHALDAGFSIRTLSLVDRGWVWAIAHVRGGSEKGWGWFLDGRRERKTNTFTDFISCTEHLHAQGYGAPARTCAYGGSAGGMLMGAIANLRPDLYAGIIAAVPFVDVLNTMSDVDLPLTPPEWPEWGNPLEDAEAYDRIAAYSPYDNVADRAYPAVLATGGLSDPRVTYWEPGKWVARLRYHQQGPAPILLKLNLEAGHGGASGRFDFLKEIALDYAFAVAAVDGTLPR